MIRSKLAARFVAVLFCLSLSGPLSGAALAQTSAATGATGAAPSTNAATSGSTTSAAPAATNPAATNPDVIQVPVWPTIAVALPDATPVQAAFSLGAIDGVSPDLLAGVTAHGYARKVTVNSDQVGQVMVVSVSKGDQSAAIANEGLNAQFDATNTSSLFPSNTVDVTGSKAALIAALQKLVPVKVTNTTSTPSSDSGTPAASQGNSANDMAAAYKSPTPLASTPTTASTPTDITSTNTTTEGCTVRIDLLQMKAYQQSKVQTLTNGTVTTDGTCSDSEVSWPLNKSYSSCPDVVDTANMVAYPQYTLYYTDNGAANHTVTDCAKDASSPYTITEDESQCSIVTDIVAGTATPQAALVYTNRNNAVVQARGCANSIQDPAIAMSKVTSGCTIRNDFAASLSYEQAMWTYARKGVTYQATPCADDGITFPQTKSYQDAGGNNLCTPITDMTGMTVTLQYRLQITNNGLTTFITDCTPDTTSHAVVSTTDGCMDPSAWTHDLSAGVSYGQERFFYLKPDGTTRIYITACQTSTVTYPQSVTVVGYQNHDDQLWAYPLMTVTITVAGSPYTIVSSQVLSGAAQMAYVLNGTVDTPDGNSTYQGCQAYRETTRYDQWARPDNTTYQQAIGLGTPVGPIDVCSKSLLGSRTLASGYNVTVGYGGLISDFGDNGYIHITTTTNYSATVFKYQYANTETGAVVSASCQFQDTWKQLVASSSQTSSYGANGPWPSTDTQTLLVPPCPF